MGLYLILMGVQGAGKGMQAQFLKDHYKIPHVSTGDLFRAMKTRQDELALRVQAIMKSGSLVDDATTNDVVADRLAQPDAAQGVILDGYPRNQFQADFLAQYLAARDEKVSAVLLLHLDLYTAFKRAFGRVSDAQGNSYNIYFHNEGLQVSFEDSPDPRFPSRLVVQRGSEELIRRPDDANAAAIIKRIDTYLDTTRPLIEYYQARDLVHEVEADQSIEAVSRALQQIIDGLR